MIQKRLLSTFLLTLATLLSLSAQDFEIYISDAGNFDQPPWQILKFDQNGENGKVFIADHLAWPQDILFLEDENAVLISNLNTGVISRFNATTGAYIDEFATGINGPTRMKIGPDGLLYVLQWQNTGKVLRYQLDGTFVDGFTAAGIPSSIGLDWDSEGNLYVSSYGQKYVRKFSPTGADLGLFISDNLSGPTNIWFGDNGDLYVIDYLGNGVKRFLADGTYAGVFINGLANGEGIDFFPNGNLAIGVGAASSVRIYDPSGNYIEELVPSGTLDLLVPNAVVFRETAVSSTTEAYRDLEFVTPTIGTVFELSKPELLQPDSTIRVFDQTGKWVGNLDPVWDASEQPAGIYHIIAKLADGATARQKIVVQK